MRIPEIEEPICGKSRGLTLRRRRSGDRADFDLFFPRGVPGICAFFRAALQILSLVAAASPKGRRGIQPSKKTL